MYKLKLSLQAFLILMLTAPVFVIVLHLLLLLLTLVIPGFPSFSIDDIITFYVNSGEYVGLPLAIVLTALFVRRKLAR